MHHQDDLDALKWLLENGCPWSEGTLAAAAGAQEENLDVLKWLHSAGCPWDDEVFAAAAERGNHETVNWLHETLRRPGQA